MSIKTNYFDGHTYSAADDRRPWYSLMDDGVFGIATQALKVVASSPADLSVNVQPGACIVAGYYIYSDAVVNLPIIANTSGYNRVDIVVVEVDEVNKETDIRIVQGTPTSSPTAPLPNEQQYVLAEIFVGNNVSVIENSNITDRRKEAMTKTLKTHQADYAAHLIEFLAHVFEGSGKHVHSSGSNWIKYDCGIAECWGDFQVTGKIDQPWENLFYLRVDSIPYPQGVGFIARPHCVFMNLGTRSWFHTQVGGTASSTPTLDIYRPIADTVDQTYSIGYRAIGRWK